MNIDVVENSDDQTEVHIALTRNELFLLSHSILSTFYRGPTYDKQVACLNYETKLRKQTLKVTIHDT